MEKIPEQSEFDGLRIVLYGPESTGKSTLANQLAAHYQEPQVSEFARVYLQEKMDRTGTVCSFGDIVPIAIGQRESENKAATQAGRLLFCDTDILETYVYSTIYFNRAPQELVRSLKASSYDLYLLMDIDTKWTPDDLRDRPQERKSIFKKFQQTLEEFKQPYKIITELGHQRFLNAIAAIDDLLL
ncbi:AAA family ATPase [Nonlabens marinus]|uniref:Ribosylnicotinamide kinase n=1 Tax=Nonlabens marinus S1-08 TaxID=1454201 RepID=W8VPW3_9FLAO|nr:ATP-binding protein [Nonlabens marinus]BAO54685.1 ribosylnicotinamide kinase [Nonlabens marinus S1-08]